MPQSIVALVGFLLIWILGVLLLAANYFSGSDGGSFIWLAFAVCGPIGAIAATVELIRSAIQGDQEVARSRRR